MFERPGCFEIIRQGKPGEECAHAHIIVDCPKCRADFLGEIVSPLPYRGAADLSCGCGYKLRVYVDTDTGEVTVSGTRVCSIVRDG